MSSLTNPSKGSDLCKDFHCLVKWGRGRGGEREGWWWCAELRSDVMNWGVFWWIEEWCDELRWIEEWCDKLRWIEEWCDKLWCDEKWCAELRSDVTNWGVMWWIEGKGANWWPRECNRATQNRQTRNRTKIGYRELATVGSMHTYAHSKVIMNKLRHAKNTHRQFHSKSSGQEINVFCN